MHAQDLGGEGDLVLIDEPFGIGLPQDLAHPDRSRLAILLALPAEPRGSGPTRGRKRASRNPAEHRRERRVELVGVDPSKHAEHVRDVFRPRAGGAWSCEGGVAGWRWEGPPAPRRRASTRRVPW